MVGFLRASLRSVFGVIERLFQMMNGNVRESVGVFLMHQGFAQKVTIQSAERQRRGI